MKQHLLSLGLLLLLLPWLTYCGNKSEIGATNVKSNLEPTPIITTDHQSYRSQATTIKPPVDILIIWDNSSTFNFINRETKNALRKVLTDISDKFDYHLILAPLLVNEGENPLYVMAANATSLDQSLLNNTHPSITLLASDEEARLDLFAQLKGSKQTTESGLQRAIDILGANITNGIFRQNSYTIVVLTSNENEDGYEGAGIKSKDTAYLAQKVNELSAIGTDQLKSIMLRFLSIVAHTNGTAISAPCKYERAVRGHQYIYASQMLYAKVPSAYRDSISDKYQDSFDLCKSEQGSVFDSINQTIHDIMIKHVYSYWPIVEDLNYNFEPTQLTVFKCSGTEVQESATDGYQYFGYKSAWPLRTEPSIGEYRTGHLLKLNGNAQVTYPDCLVVTTQKKFEYFNLYPVAFRPKLSTLQVTINGVAIAQDSRNGWSFSDTKYYPSRNIRITSPTDLTPMKPERLKSGYFIQLNGTAIYSNNDVVKITYQREAL